MDETEDPGTGKSSGSVSESESEASSSGGSTDSSGSSDSSGDGPPWPPDDGGSSSSSSSSGESGDVECICDVVVGHVRSFDAGGGAYQVEFVVTAGGTCDVTIVGFRSSYEGLYDFTSVPQFILAGADGLYVYSRDGDPAGNEIFVSYVCENGHEEEISYIVPES